MSFYPEKWPWPNAEGIPSRSFVCWRCHNRVAPDRGLRAEHGQHKTYLYVCSHCGRPTFFDWNEEQVPGVAHGTPIAKLPVGVADLYEEARRCMAVSAYTSAVLGCRKLLMNLAVAHGVAGEGGTFASYVGALADAGYVPPRGRQWVTKIKDAGNEATHEIRMKSQAEAQEILRFTEMLLRFSYEFPPDEEPAPPS